MLLGEEANFKPAQIGKLNIIKSRAGEKSQRLFLCVNFIVRHVRFFHSSEKTRQCENHAIAYFAHWVVFLLNLW